MNTLTNSYDFFEQLAELDVSHRQLFEILLKKQGLDLFQLPIPKREKTANIPLSYAQERIWNIGQLIPDLPVDNVPQAFHIQGKLNVKIFEQSLNILIQQNEVLRTIYIPKEDRIEPMIAPAYDIKLEVIDLSQLPQEKRWHQAKQQATEFSRQPFDFAQDILLRSRIYDLGDRDYILLLVSHQLATDGLSVRFLLQELAEHYRAISSDKLISESQSRIQYSDYAVWQRQLFTEAAFVSQKKYWQQKLSGSPTRLSLPTTSKINSLNFDGAYEPFQLSPSLSEEFRELCKSQGITVFMALVALFQTVLYRCTPEEEICLGTLTSIRNHTQIEKRVGNFSNNLLLKTNFSEDLRICDLFKRVRETTLDAFINQDIPFQSLSKTLEVPQFQVFLLVRDSSAAQNLELPGLEIQDFPIDFGFTRMELSLDLTDDGQSSIRGKLEYKKHIFESNIIKRIVVNLKNLVEQAVNNSEQLISEIVLPENIDVKSPNQFRLDSKETFVAAQNYLEQQLTIIWEEVLGIKTISIKDNFFELGGHSLLAVELFDRIKQISGINLPLATLFQAPTIEQLANLIDKSDKLVSWSSLVPIQPHGIKVPFFCVHGLGGDVLSFYELSHHLGQEQPFYGLQAQGLDGKQAPFTRMEDMAAHYIQHIRRLQPEGPYLLGGLSSGGTIAFEMALQLESQGQKVALLVMLDSLGPKYSKSMSFRDWFTRHTSNFLNSKQEDRFYYLLQGFKSLKTRLKNRLPLKFYKSTSNSELVSQSDEQTKLVSIKASNGEEFYLRDSGVLSATTKALQNYEPKAAYLGKFLLLKSNEQPWWSSTEPDLGWSNLLDHQQLEIFEVPGHHYNMFLEPNVGIIAEKLRNCFEHIQ